jgi:CHAD domain-containing protein
VAGRTKREYVEPMGLAHLSSLENRRENASELRQYVYELATTLVSRIFNRAEKIGGKKAEEALHDMRVATRRLRETLSMFVLFYPPRRLKRVLARIKKMTQVLGLPREADVNAALMARLPMPGNASSTQQAAKEHLLEILEDERVRRHRKMKKAFSRLDLAALKRELRSLSKAGMTREMRIPASSHFDPMNAPERSWLESLWREKGRPFLQYDEEKLRAMDDQALHQLRIQTKKLRYALEIINPIAGNSFDLLIQSARELQDLLGECHDFDVLMAVIRNHREALKAGNRLLLAEAMGEVIGTLQSKKEEAIQKVPRLFAVFFATLDLALPASFRPSASAITPATASKSGD